MTRQHADPPPSARSGRAGLMLALATVGFVVNFWAWALLSPLGPRFADTLRLGSFAQALVVAVPVVVGSLGRIPVGALTDRYGGRIMFPVVTAVTIVPVLYLGLAGQSSLAGLLVGGFFLGIGGTTFAIPETAYRWFSSVAGTVAAVGVIVGVVLLAYRRTLIPRVRATTSPVDWVALILLAVVIVLGIIPTIGVNLLGAGYDYRTSVALWFRGLFAANPDVAAIAHAPLIYQIHATAAWAILAVWPFTRLVHAWSYPLWYLWRPFIVYRDRVPARPTEPGTSGRRWRRIGVPY